MKYNSVRIGQLFKSYEQWLPICFIVILPSTILDIVKANIIFQFFSFHSVQYIPSMTFRNFLELIQIVFFHVQFNLVFLVVVFGSRRPKTYSRWIYTKLIVFLLRNNKFVYNSRQLMGLFCYFHWIIKYTKDFRNNGTRI